jgi:RNA polymerase sigma factor (sigma-70 family)
MIEQALEAHRDLMRRFAAGPCGVPIEDAEDVAQDAALRAWVYRATFTGESAVATWLLSIVKRCAYDYHRARRAERAAFSLLDPQEVFLPEAPVLRLSATDRQFAETVDAATLRASRSARRRLARIRKSLKENA